MSLKSIHTAFRLYSAALIALAFTLAPMATAAHANEGSDFSCSIDHDAEAPVDDTSGEHEHHVHNCGPCHIHIIPRDVAAELAPRALQAKLRPPLTSVTVRAPPGGLFRPPRS